MQCIDAGFGSHWIDTGHHATIRFDRLGNGSFAGPPYDRRHQNYDNE
jgi:hypothetical protein